MKSKSHLHENKAVYTATEVACGWAGAVKTTFFKQLSGSSNAKTACKGRKKLTETDRLTNRPPDVAGHSRIAHN